MRVRRGLAPSGAPIARHVIALVAIVVAISGLGVASSYADSGKILFDSHDGHGFVHDLSSPLLSFDRLAPGYSTSGNVDVKNASSEPVAFYLKAFDVQDDDNGCIAPETRDGDTDCGNGGGELGEWLVLTLTGTDADGVQHVTWTGSIYDLADGTYLSRAMPAGAVWDMHMTAALPWAAGNNTMTDRLGFGLRWTMEGASATTEGESPGGVTGGGGSDDAGSDDGGTETVADGGEVSTGDGVAAPSGGDSVVTVIGSPATAGTGFLPATGTMISLGVLLLGLGLLGAGAVLVLYYRPRRD